MSALQDAKDRVTTALKEYGQKERSLVNQDEIVNLLLDVQQSLAQVVEVDVEIPDDLSELEEPV